MGRCPSPRPWPPTDTNVGKLKVVSLLESLPGVGKVKARKIMEEIGIADNRRVQGLGAAAEAVAARTTRQVSLAATTARRPARSSSSPAPAGSARAPSSMRSSSATRRLWLSRSWTTRAQRPASPTRLRVHRPRERSSERIDDGGFLEWTEFLGNYYGTPMPDAADGPRRRARDRGRRRPAGEGAAPRRGADLRAAAVARRAGAPAARPRRPRRQGRSRACARPRTRSRSGVALADHVVVNDDSSDTVDEMLAIIDARTASARREPRSTPVAFDRLLQRAARRPRMARTHDTMMNPPIEELLDRVDSKFSLVTLAARRARKSTRTSTSSVTASATWCRRRCLGRPQAAEHRLRGDRRRQDRASRAARGRRRRGRLPTATRRRDRRLTPAESTDLPCSPASASSSGSPAASPPTRPSRSAAGWSTPAPTSCR